MSGADDDRWRHATLDVADPATAVTRSDKPTEPATLRRRPSGPFDPPRRERFEERGELGRGGMGRVFEARDTALDRPVAIKQSLTDNEIDIARFERETLITARLQHPGIVPVLDAGRDDQGRPYYIMRKIEGRRLADLIADAKTVAERIALVPRILGAVDAIAYAHARGVIHRDLKSWNVLLGDFGETLVIDWGLARDIDDTTAEPISDLAAIEESPSLTRAGVAYGTPGFMPPEQARGEKLDRRADVYALGALLLHALQGTHPFAGVTARDAIAKIAADAAPDLSAIPDEVPPELTAIVAKAMEPKAADRYPDAAALAEDLRRFTTGQLVAAHQYTLAELIARWLHRHRVAVTIGALSVIALVVIGIVAVRGVIAERDRADTAAAAEAARADQLLVQRADATVLEDPTKSLAMLKQLRPESGEWEHAAATYDSAIARGVTRGRRVHPGARSPWIGASSAGDVVTVAEDGKVIVHDPALIAPSRTIATLNAPRIATWFHRSVIAIEETNRMVRVELDGKTKPLQGAAAWAIATTNRLFAVDRQGVAREIDPDGGPVIGELGRVTAAAPIGDALVYATSEGFDYLAPGRAAIQVLSIPARELGVIAASPDGMHFATATSTLVVEWEVGADGPHESNRWDIAGAISVLYAGRTLIVEDAAHLYTTLGANHTSYPRRSLTGIQRVATTDGDCAYIAAWSGTLHMSCSMRSAQIGGKSEAIAGLAVTRDHLVGITYDGVLLSWDLEPLRLHHIEPEDGGFGGSILVGGKLFFDHDDQLTVYDLASQQRSTLGRVNIACITGRHLVLAPRIPRPRIEYTSIDLATLGDRRPISKQFQGVVCARDDRIALLDEHSIEIRDLSTGATRTWAIDHVPTWASFNGRWLAIATIDTGAVERIDLETEARVRTTIKPVKVISVDDAGRIATISGDRAVAWVGENVPLVELARDARGIGASPAGLIAFTPNNSLVVLDPRGEIRSYHAGAAFEPSIALQSTLATLPDVDGTPIVIDLRDGTTRRYPFQVLSAGLDMTGEQAYGYLGGLGIVWSIARPPSPVALRVAIERATNATLAPDSTRVEFPD